MAAVAVSKLFHDPPIVKITEEAFQTAQNSLLPAILRSEAQAVAGGIDIADQQTVAAGSRIGGCHVLARSNEAVCCVCCLWCLSRSLLVQANHTLPRCGV